MNPNDITHDIKNGEAVGDRLPARIRRTVEHHNMLAPGDRVLVAVSGGADSIALADLLCRLAPALRISLAIAHLDHGLRPEAAQQEAELVKRLADRLGLECHAGRIAIQRKQGSLEEQLRHMRYAFLERTASTAKCNKIAVGHHADDNAEAVLMHLLRGSGLRGLAGIPPVRDRRIIRPLIEVRRAEILAYLRHRGMAYLEDASNADPRFTRNKIRHHLIPLLQRHYNPNVVSTLNRLATLCLEEEAWLGTQLEPLTANALSSGPDKGIELNSETLLAQPRPVRRRLIRTALDQWQGHLRRIGAIHIEALMTLLSDGAIGGSLDLPNRVKAERTATGLLFRISTGARGATQITSTPAYQYRLEAMYSDHVTLNITEAGCALQFSVVSPVQMRQIPSSDPQKVLFDLEHIEFPLTIRNFRPGDRLQPFGMQGSQKLKNLFIDRQIPRDRRHRLPLLVSGDTVIWVAGVRRAAAAAISPDTSRALKVEIVEGI